LISEVSHSAVFDEVAWVRKSANVYLSIWLGKILRN